MNKTAGVIDAALYTLIQHYYCPVVSFWAFVTHCWCFLVLDLLIWKANFSFSFRQPHFYSVCVCVPPGQGWECARLVCVAPIEL